ncbi:PREDICTED: tumor necrosis factor receptor superfamily member 10D-like [Cercocebus atys]|uniref:tumor necrosis factor receptor superfamily member 10D-like n=1 Tax=Cercocebus atys TaxID=9531 RepID=UPI0005F3779A|nr:PREDICTED: tumor necrosis factor receptor superfamily member 10D-like [Cercocebus atys]
MQDQRFVSISMETREGKPCRSLAGWWSGSVLDCRTPDPDQSIPHCVLQEQAEAEVCQRRRLPVPVNGADPTEINTLLEASHTERHAKEIIQDQLVGSKKFFYEEGDAGSAASCV